MRSGNAVSPRAKGLLQVLLNEQPAAKKKTGAKQTLQQPALVSPARAQQLTAKDKATLEQIKAGSIAPHLAVDALVAMVESGKLTPKDAIMRIDPKSVGRFHVPTFDATGGEPIANGMGVSDGCASGVVVFDPAEAERRGKAGEKVILAIRRLEPEQINALKYVAGVISGEADRTAHASVIAREFGKPCVASWDWSIGGGQVGFGSTTIKEGEAVSINGTSGDVYAGSLPVTTHGDRPSFKKLMAWARGMVGTEIRTNADSAASIERALAFGATGVGLVRTEHMFFGDRLKYFQAAILGGEMFGPEERKERLKDLLRFQQEDFQAIFAVTKDKPVSIRLLDPPLHEFLPKLPEDGDNAFQVDQLADHLQLDPAETEKKLADTFGSWTQVDPKRIYVEVHQDSPEMEEVAKLLEVSPYSLRKRIRMMQETNPMLGLRGVRLGVRCPDLYEMQVEAIFRAAAAEQARKNFVTPKILVPMVNSAEELKFVREIVDRVKAQVEKETGTELDYEFGAMIETPHAALKSHELAAHCDFFSFGTNDLTQAAYGLSRDDAQPIEKAYEEAGVETKSPFESIDPESVGALIKVSLGFARFCGDVERPEFSGGICGEQGADPRTIADATSFGVDYVSVSPYRVASAILASAQANIASESKSGPDVVSVRKSVNA